MINAVPSSWDYSDKLENLFLFYQASEEMLSFTSPDSYRLTTHNSLTLCDELENVFGILKRSNQLDDYYKKYTNPIIDELIYTIQQDSIIKREFGARLDSIITGLTSAKENHALLQKWINQIKQSCTIEKYIECCKKILSDCIINNQNKKELLYFANSYYVSLIFLGFDSEFLYQNVKRFFDSKHRKITSPEQINLLFKQFVPQGKEIELLFVADTYLIKGFEKIIPELKSVIEIKELSEDEVLPEVKKSTVLNVFYENYNRLKSRESITMISYKTVALDPYCALSEIESFFDLLQAFNGYFKHKSGHRIYFDVVQKTNNKYYPIKARRIIPNRPYIDQEIIDSRLRTLLKEKVISRPSMQALTSALNMHLDAINCQNEDTMLRTFWTATEALFFDPLGYGERENAIVALSRILEKTYLLKSLRIVYSQIKDAISNSELKKISISNFQSFVCYFSSFEQDSEEFKRITSLLSNNPLLRSRVYNLRKELSDTKHISEKISQHNKRINWQILRIYRTRNLSTHAGISVPFIKDILFNIHNYFDYVINYVICKIENKEFIPNVSAVVFEAKNDNLIHIERLKKEEKLSKDNYIELLFGPDRNLILYEFETNFSNEDEIEQQSELE